MNLTRRWIGLIAILFLLAALVAAQRKKTDEWAINNALIGPDSPIEVAAGDYYSAQVMYPVPDGPLFPLKTTVVWSIVPPVQGISVDKKTGKITVNAGVAHGTFARVTASIAEKRLPLKANLYVFRPEENPLIGRWSVDPKTTCDDGHETRVTKIPSPFFGPIWKFHVNKQFFAGREYGIAAGIKLSGSYEMDLVQKTLKLVTQWPKNVPEKNWTFDLRDEGKELLLYLPEIEPGCSYKLHREEMTYKSH